MNEVLKKYLKILSYLIVPLIVAIIFINYAFYKPTVINSFVAAKIYLDPANENFIDDNFYQCVVDEYNKIADKTIAYTDSMSDEQLALITNIWCTKEVNDFTGTEKLINIKSLSMSEGNANTIDLSKNIKLKRLSLQNYGLKEIDLSNNPQLDDVYLPQNELTSLDLSKNINLKQLVLRENPIVSINLNGLNLLERLELQDTNLTTIDLSASTNLKKLFLDDSEIINLDLSNNIYLEELYMDNSPIENINIAKCKVLKILNLSLSKNLASIDLTKNLLLEEVYLGNSNINKIDLSENINLKKLYIGNNLLQTINLTNNVLLTDLRIEENQLQSLILPNTTSLETINVSNNKLTELDISKIPNIITLWASNNLIENIIFAQNHPQIESLYLDNNKLSELEISDFVTLKSLDLSDNNINNLDVTYNTALEYITLDNTYISDLNLENIVNLKHISLNNIKISNIDVTKHTELTHLYLDNTNISELNLNKNVNLTTLSLINSKLSTIDLSKNVNLTTLSLMNSKLSSIDLSKNIKLEELSIGGIGLKEISLENLSVLKTLEIDNTEISEVEIKNLSELSSISITNSQLTEIDLPSSATRVNLANNNIDFVDISGLWLYELDLTGNIYNDQECVVYRGEYVSCPSYSKQNEVLYFDELGVNNNYIQMIDQPIISSPNADINREKNKIMIEREGKYNIIETYYRKLYISGTTPMMRMFFDVNNVINVLSIDSNKYIINEEKNVIFTLNDIETDTIKNNIKVYGNIDINDGKLAVSYNGKVAKEFLISNVITDYNIFNNKLYLENEIDFTDFTDNFKCNNCKYHIYDENENVISSGNVKKGNFIEIFIEENKVFTFEIVDNILEFTKKEFKNNVNTKKVWYAGYSGELNFELIKFNNAFDYNNMTLNFWKDNELVNNLFNYTSTIDGNKLNFIVTASEKVEAGEYSIILADNLISKKIDFSIEEPLEIKQNNINITKNYTRSIQYNLIQNIDYTDNLEFISFNPEIATVDENGLVEGISEGTTTIRVKTTDGSNLEKEIKVKVVPYFVEKLDVGQDQILLLINRQNYISYNIDSISQAKSEQDVAQYFKDISKYEKVQFSSDNPEIATVNENGRVEGISEGTTTIRVKTLDGSNIEKEIKVTIYPQIKEITIDENQLDYIFARNHLVVAANKSKKIKYSIEPNDEFYNDYIKWTSNHETGARVEQDGTVTGITTGQTIINLTTTDGSDLGAQIWLFVYPNAIEDIKVPKEIGLAQGNKKSISYTLTPNEGVYEKLEFSSDNPEIATVNENGLIEGISEGTTTIRVKTLDGSNIEKEIKVSIYPNEINNIVIDESQLSSITSALDKYLILAPNKSKQIKYTLSPNEGIYDKLEWESVSPNIATVDEFGNVTGLAEGTARINVSTKDGSSVKRYFYAKVYPNAIEKIEIKEEEVRVSEGRKTNVPEYTLLPSEGVFNKLKWIIDDPEIATVDGYGNITGVKGGTTTIRAKSLDGSNIEEKIKLIVYPNAITKIDIHESYYPMLKGKSLELNYTLTPSEGVNPNVTWKSSDETVATVDKYGKVTAVGYGEAIITVKTEDGAKIDKCTIIVSKPTINIGTETITSISNNTLYEGYGGVINIPIETENIEDNTPLIIKYIKDNVEMTNDEILNVFNMNNNVVYNNKVDLQLEVKTVALKGKYELRISTETAEEQTFKFEIYEPILVENIKANNIILELNSTKKVEYTITNDDALNKNVKFIIRNKDENITEIVATVDENGNITGKNLGEALLTISSKDGGATKEISVKVIEEYDLKTDKYNIDYDLKIHKIKDKLSLEDFIKNFTIKDGIIIKAFKNNNEIDNTEVIGTGYKIRTYSNEELRSEYTLIVSGDTNGDGSANATDILAQKLHILNKTALTDEYFTAGDINEDGNVNATDILYIKMYILGKYSTVWGK